jgi:hypothetical protein
MSDPTGCPSAKTSKQPRKEAPDFVSIPVEGCMSSTSGGSRGGGRW